VSLLFPSTFLPYGYFSLNAIRVAENLEQLESWNQEAKEIQNDISREKASTAALRKVEEEMVSVVCMWNVGVSIYFLFDLTSLLLNHVCSM